MGSLKQYLCLLNSYDRESGWVEEPYLREEGCLVPVNVFVGDLVALKFHHRNMRQLHMCPSGGMPGSMKSISLS